MKNLISILLLFFVSVSNAEVVERVVAIVNGGIITEMDIRNFRSTLKKGQLVDDLLVQDPKKLLSNRKAVVDHLINEKIIDSEVKKENLSVTVERIEKEIRTITKRNGISRNQLKQALGQQGVKFSEYQDFIRKRLERQSLVEKAITSKIKISDEDIANQYYSKNPKAAGAQNHEYTIAHIMFRPKGGDVAAAKERAEKLLPVVKGGADFGELASKNSEDPNFTTGGLLGTFKTGEFSKAFESAVKKLNPGETSGVVKSKFGYHILKLIDRKVIADPRFQKKSAQIKNQLYEKAFKRQFAFWLEQKRRQSFIRVN